MIGVVFDLPVYWLASALRPGSVQSDMESFLAQPNRAGTTSE